MTVIINSVIHGMPFRERMNMEGGTPHWKENTTKLRIEQFGQCHPNWHRMALVRVTSKGVKREDPGMEEKHIASLKNTGGPVMW